eukprot:9570975-Alexandrium_andersonii.AAC.1
MAHALYASLSAACALTCLFILRCNPQLDVLAPCGGGAERRGGGTLVFAHVQDVAAAVLHTGFWVWWGHMGRWASTGRQRPVAYPGSC